jgi:hypothetical protein
MSSYRPTLDGFLYRDNGEPVPAIGVVGGIYAPDTGIEVAPDDDGREGLLFPGKEEWWEGNLCESFPWPGWHRVEFDASEALRQFVGLENARDVVRFAAEYGPLWACYLHPFPCLWRGVNLPDEHGVRDAWVNYEPLDWWLGAVRRLAGTLVAARRVQDGEPLRDQDWRALGFLPPDPDESYPSGAWDGLWVSAAINGELQRYGVGLHLDIQLRAELNTGLGFLPALWQQAAAMIAGGRAIAVCSNCAHPYLRRERSPKRGQHNFCPECGHARKRFSYHKSKSDEPEHISGE